MLDDLCSRMGVRLGTEEAESNCSWQAGFGTQADEVKMLVEWVGVCTLMQEVVENIVVGPGGAVGAAAGEEVVEEEVDRWC